MSFTNVRAIPSPEAVISLVPLSAEAAKTKKANDKRIADVITGKDKRFIVIVGPCSADDEDAVMEYMNKLKEVNEQVKDKLVIVPRVYTGKPRTTGEGYKGMMHQPDPTKAPNMLEGLLTIRKLFIRVIEETGMPVADEMLYPSNLPFVSDLLSYIAIGARSVENQQHRLTASGIDCAVGMKNPTSGYLTVMFNSIRAAQSSHNFLYNGHEVRTTGNPLAHAIMRGSVNKHGNNLPNYHYEDLRLAYNMYVEGGYLNPTVIIDANHSNSGKKFFEQPRIVKEVLHSRSYNADIEQMVKGVMIESYLEEGNQDGSEPHIYGKSITDPCLGFEDTKALLFEIAERV
ncbi:MAG: 3-deoxy-7-phosphoheptulonate synthase [Firmicutes bacterium]|nr:3-deoxy-7-phosphoheptulonate synthase [Bacillota bacterium]